MRIPTLAGVQRAIARTLVNMLPGAALDAALDAARTKARDHRRTALGACGANVHLAPSVVVYSPNAVKIGDDCALNDYVHILGSGGVTLGRGVWIASHASIISHSHPTDVEYVGDHPPLEAPVCIGDHVWIGSHAVVLPGVTIARGAVVAAGAVVLQDVPANAVVGGVPARVLRYKRTQYSGASSIRAASVT